jgi:hypothetical protein
VGEIISFGMSQSLKDSIHAPKEFTPEEVTSPNKMTSTPQPTFVIQPLKPEAFAGRKGESIEGWISQMEQYFKLCNVTDSNYQANYGSSCLKDNASVWWRNYIKKTQVEDWESFKKAIIAQFKPVNASKIARDKLAKLRQTKSVQDYVYAFRATILEIEDISESETLDRFIRGLKDKTRQEVELRDPETMDEAARIAERYDTIAFKTSNTFRPSAKSYQEYDDKGVRPMEIDALERKPLTEDERERLRRIGGCFYCRERGHMVNNCPKRRQKGINVVEKVEKEKKLKSCVKDTKREEEEEEQEYEGIQNTDYNDHKMPALINTVEDSQINLLYYVGKIKDKEVNVLVDGGSVGNFISEELAKKLNLNTSIVAGQNLVFAGGESKFSNKEARAVKLYIGNFCERIHLRLAPLPHHDIILGKPWLDHWNPSIDWPTSTITIDNKGDLITLNPISGKVPKNELNFISAKQIVRAFKKGEDDFVLAILKESNIESERFKTGNEGISNKGQTILTEFADVFPDKIPPGLPPEREFDHKIELETGAEPPFKPVYRMSQDELEELRVQLTELMESGYIQPSRSPYAAPVIFVKKKRWD